jgi:hypothetical protein
MSGLALPRRARGHQSPAAIVKYADELAAWCDRIKQINSRLDFRVSSRGWCYILEDKGGVLKGEFKSAELLINDCRKSGLLPLNICSDDEGRSADGIEDLDRDDINQRADDILDRVTWAHTYYEPISFWDTQDEYVEMVTEKVDLKSLFTGLCGRYHIPITNGSGWNDINSRAAIMKRFAAWEAKGKQCVLLYCGDHDPGGLHISESIPSNYGDLANAVGWSPDNLIIERFGLDYDFITAQELPWIDNLETSGGKYPLNDPRHHDHGQPYVQSYLKQFGVRKCEANALVTRPEAGRELCLSAILRHVDQAGIREYESNLAGLREDLGALVRQKLADGELS